MVVCYLTKPTRQDFVNYVSRSLSGNQIPPIVDYQDKFLYAKVTATYVDIPESVPPGTKKTAVGTRVEFIGVFNKFWQVKNTTQE